MPPRSDAMSRVSDATGSVLSEISHRPHPIPLPLRGEGRLYSYGLAGVLRASVLRSGRAAASFADVITTLLRSPNLTNARAELKQELVALTSGKFCNRHASAWQKRLRLLVGRLAPDSPGPCQGSPVFGASRCSRYHAQLAESLGTLQFGSPVEQIQSPLGIRLRTLSPQGDEAGTVSSAAAWLVFSAFPSAPQERRSARSAG